METTLNAVKNKIKTLEIEVEKAETNLRLAEGVYKDKVKNLENHKIALKIFEELNNNIPVVINRAEGKLTIRQQLLNLIKEATSDISTGDLIEAYCKNNRVDKKKARNSIYPNLSALKEDGVIKPYKNDPKANGSFWQIKEKTPQEAG